MNYKEKRKKKGMSQSAVAVAAGISLMTYQLIERGVTKKPQKDNKEAIEKVLS